MMIKRLLGCEWHPSRPLQIPLVVTVCGHHIVTSTLGLPPDSELTTRWVSIAELPILTSTLPICPYIYFPTFLRFLIDYFIL